MFNWYPYTDYAVAKEFKKNTTLFKQGEQVNGFFYLHEGKIAISLVREDGYERIIDFVYPGSLTGEQMINSSTSFTNATIVADAVLYFFSKEDFDLLNQKHTEISHQFGKSLISKIRLLADINTILNAPVHVQLAHFLLNLAKKEGKNHIPISQTDLARYIGKSRVSIWKVLKEWKEEEMIEMHRQSIVLKKTETLKSLV